MRELLKFVHTCLKHVVAPDEMKALYKFETAIAKADLHLHDIPECRITINYIRDYSRGRRVLISVARESVKQQRISLT